MVLGWRKAFCTSISKNQEKEKSDASPSTKIGSRLSGFFSNASTPTSSAPPSPKLQCKTSPSPSPRFLNPSSPSTFSFLKSGLRISKSRCGICLHRVKTGQGTAIFTAECGHSFHFPCVAAHGSKLGSSSLACCPNCGSIWKEMQFFQTAGNLRGEPVGTRCKLKLYNDDEPLASPTSGERFNPIPEFDETEEEIEEFPGFCVAAERKARIVEVALSPKAAVVSVGKSSQIYALILKIKAPAATVRRAPVDLVAVLNVSRSITAEKLHLMKRSMRLVVSSLSAADRLSIVAFSTTSKRLLPLRRMNTAGRRSARRIIDAIVALNGSGIGVSDSLKKAAKVIDDRREKNVTASIVLFSDEHHHNGSVLSSMRITDSDIPLHSISLGDCLHVAHEDFFARCIDDLLSSVVLDLKIQLGFTADSAPAEISAIYSHKLKPEFLGPGSSWCLIGDFHAQEEREFLIEMKVPSSVNGIQRRRLSVSYSYKDPSTQQSIHDHGRPLVIPYPRAVGYSTEAIQRLKCLYITARAIAVSNRLVEKDDLTTARHVLASAVARVLQTGSGSDFVRGLEAELAELSGKRKDQIRPLRRNSINEQEKAEPLTPTSAWRAAERLAKLAVMRKSLNRVSDLHGFENAGF